jgi:hypothetical protein
MTSTGPSPRSSVICANFPATPMEADWEVEIGGDAPVIDARWAGFIDLRLEPEQAAMLPEASQLPALAPALVRVNASGSPMWTSKSDVWEENIFDPDEMDALQANPAFALACYIDLLPRTGLEWRVSGQAVAACKRMCGHLRHVPLRSCRADLIVRLAWVTSDPPEHGITAYLTACGSTLEEARATLDAALVALADSILCRDDVFADPSKLQ